MEITNFEKFASYEITDSKFALQVKTYPVKFVAQLHWNIIVLLSMFPISTWHIQRFQKQSKISYNLIIGEKND